MKWRWTEQWQEENEWWNDWIRKVENICPLKIRQGKDVCHECLGSREKQGNNQNERIILEKEDKSTEG